MKQKVLFYLMGVVMAVLLPQSVVAFTISTSSITMKPGQTVEVEIPSYWHSIIMKNDYRWTASGDVVTIRYRSATSCTIYANRIGTARLEYVAGYMEGTMTGIIDASWSITVESANPVEGDKFKYTSNGVEIQYKIISASNKTCMVGGGFGEGNLAVPKSLSVQALTIPETANGYKVVEVAECAFLECKNIKSIIMPETIEHIGQNAFQGCTSLTSITIPDAVTEIDYGAFSLLDNLEEVVIGKSVRKFGNDVFWDDKKLRSITVLATEPPSVGNDIFYLTDVYSTATLYVPEGCIAKYRDAYIWGQFANIEKIGGGYDEPEFSVAIDATNFPDANFRNYLLEQSFGADGVITEKEIKEVTSLYVYGKNISSLKGIEYFTALKRLECYSNQLTTLDVSSCTALTRLVCSDNQLIDLNVSTCVELTYLSCYSNQLTTLDVTKCPKLEHLSCYSNQLTALDVTKCPKLTYLSCGANQLAALDVTKCPELTSLSCATNQLVALDVTKCLALTTLSCGANQLSLLDVTKCTALTSLSCYKNQLTALNLTNCTELTSLNCYENQLTTLGTLRCSALKYLYCNNNLLTALGVTNCHDIASLSCYSNQLAALDVTKCLALTTLSCGSNQLTALDVTKCAALTSLSCYSNQLAALDVTQCPALTSLSCSGNQLTSLDVSKNTGLTSLNCNANLLISLDVSNNIALTTVSCYSNSIKGAAMDVFISSLPQNTTSDEYSLQIYFPYTLKVGSNTYNEGNVCTTNHVAIAKGKGWAPQYYRGGNEWGDYEGSDPTGILLPTIENIDENTPIYDLSGQRVSNLQGKKGIYIIGGKKVLVR